MNARAGRLIAALRNIARTLLGSCGIGFYVPIRHGLVQIDAVNSRSDELMAAVRRLASTLPGTTGIGFYCFATYDFVQLTAATDADVYVLGCALELDACEIRIGTGAGRGRWWLHAASREGQGDSWIDLAGPHHKGAPPGYERTASSAPAITHPIPRTGSEGCPCSSQGGAQVQASAFVGTADGTAFQSGLRSLWEGGTMPAPQGDDEAQPADGKPPRGMGDRR